MTRELHFMGLLGMGIILITLGIAVMREDSRQAEVAFRQREDAVILAAGIYAENCVACHGASGEGIAANPPLDSDAVRTIDERTLYNTIARGRYDTTMAAFSTEEGGILIKREIEALLTLIQYGSWGYVAGVVETKGLMPPVPATIEVSDETLASISALPDGDELQTGLRLYVEHCVACHSTNLEGSAIAPALSPLSLNYTDMARIINQGVTGTVMAGWERTFSDDEVNALITFITRWEEIQFEGIVLPTLEVPVIDTSPAAIGEGERLYSLVCTQCHGVQGFGTPLAPALNNQTFLANTPDAAIQQIITGGIPGTAMPAWVGYLSDANIAAITAFLRSWEPTAPPMISP